MLKKRYTRSQQKGEKFTRRIDIATMSKKVNKKYLNTQFLIEKSV